MAMFSLSKRAEYCLLMLALLAERGKGERMNLREMAERGLPKAFTAQIANSLGQAGVLDSKEGRGGGYGLKEDPGKIKLKEVLEAVEGEIAPVGCLSGTRECSLEGLCGQKGFMIKLTAEMEKVLSKYTLTDLIKS